MSNNRKTNYVIAEINLSTNDKPFVTYKRRNGKTISHTEEFAHKRNAHKNIQCWIDSGAKVKVVDRTV